MFLAKDSKALVTSKRSSGTARNLMCGANQHARDALRTRRWGFLSYVKRARKRYANFVRDPPRRTLGERYSWGTDTLLTLGRWTSNKGAGKGGEGTD